MVQNQAIKIPMSKRFFPALLPIIGDGKYEQIYKRYCDLYSNHNFPENSILKWHLIEGILPGLAIYQILRESGESQGSALVIVDQSFEKLFSDQQIMMRKLGNLPFIYPILRLYIKPAMLRYPPAGWTLEWIQNDNNAIRFNMTSCFYYDTLTKYSVPELTASFCKVDDFIYDKMSPEIKWERSLTIGKGDTHCDFCFARLIKQ